MEPILLEARGVAVDFPTSSGLFRRPEMLHALSDVSLAVRRGDTLGIVGESGSGKSTLASTLLNLLAPTQGTILLDGTLITDIPRRAFARRVQPVFQDPYSSLNPYRRIGEIVAQPLRIHAIGDRDTQRKNVADMLDRVGLPQRIVDSLPRELSGGQRQRVAIARALVTRPDVLICDEPTSALDVSVQAQILNLLQDLQRDLGLTYIIISHNLAVVELVATSVAVMYCGRIVEEGPADSFFARPRHPYSLSLLDSVLTPDPDLSLPQALPGQLPNQLALPPGCAFHPRCPQVMPLCSELRPARRTIDNIEVECHLFQDIGAQLQARRQETAL